MKHIQSKALVALAVVLLYLLILFAGLCTMVYFPYNRLHRAAAVSSNFISQEYEASGSLTEGVSLHELGAVVIDAQGNIVEYKAPYAFGFLKFELDEAEALTYYHDWVDRDVKAVLSGKETERLIFIWDRMVSVIVIGMPLASGGAVFTLRDIWDLNVTIITFAVVYTVLFLSVLAAWGIFLKKRRIIELVQQEYIANTSHSLKSPISSIKALAETISSGLVSDHESIRHYSSIIITESIALEHTVSDMLKLSAIQSRQLDLAKSAAEPEAIFAKSIEKYAALCNDIMVDFRVSGSIKTLPTLRTNAKRMAEVLDILLNNALKFVRDEGCISLDAEQSGKRVRVAVHNDGAAIDAETGRHIFDRFYKGTTPQNAKGSGLGLAIARETTASLGEKLWYENDPEGVTFYFTVEIA